MPVDLSNAPNMHRLLHIRERVAELPSGRPSYFWRTGTTFLVEWARERLEMMEERRLLGVVRDGHDLCWEATDEPEPTVTVLIPTFNRGQLIVDRALSSVISQTYTRLDILVVGDHCDSATEAAVRSVSDARIRFVNLPRRGLYPVDHRERWMVAGTAPTNVGHSLAAGAWIAPCDDDDAFTADHVEVLLREARDQKVELLCGRARRETRPGVWDVIGGEPLRHGHVSHGAVFYAAPLTFLRFSNTSWKLLEPTDWNMWRRMRDIGVRIGFTDAITYTHHVEAYMRGNGQ